MGDDDFVAPFRVNNTQIYISECTFIGWTVLIGQLGRDVLTVSTALCCLIRCTQHFFFHDIANKNVEIIYKISLNLCCIKNIED